jgi:hypothetical protein
MSARDADRAAVVAQSSLYYPLVTPPTEWLKQTLLISDRVSSITPEDFRFENEDIRWLSEAGLWRPTHTNTLYDIREYREEIESALLFFTYGLEYRFVGGNPPAPTTKILLGKMEYAIEVLLFELNLASPRFQDHTGILVHREVAAVILAITAKYAAERDQGFDRRVITSTDSLTARRYARLQIPESAALTGSYELLLEGLLPCPGPMVSLRDVVDFRERHRDELLRFRIEIHRLIRSVESDTDPMEALRSSREQIESAIRDLERAGRARRIVFQAGTISALIAATVLHVSVDREVAIALDGFAVPAVAAIGTATYRSRTRTGAYDYLLSVQEIRDRSAPSQGSRRRWLRRPGRRDT